MSLAVERARKESKEREALIQRLSSLGNEHGVQTVRSFMKLEIEAQKNLLVKCQGNDIYVTQGKIQALMELEDHLTGLSRPRRG